MKNSSNWPSFMVLADGIGKVVERFGLSSAGQVCKFEI